MRSKPLKRRQPNNKRLQRWKIIKTNRGDHADWYEISNYGKIRIRGVVRRRSSNDSKKINPRHRLLTPVYQKGKPGYIRLRTRDKQRIAYAIKDLVADHWMRRVSPTSRIYCKDKDKTNCSVYNLREAGVKRIRNNKLTVDEVKEIKRRLQDTSRGVKAELAKEFRISRPTITQIAKGVKWSHV